MVLFFIVQYGERRVTAKETEVRVRVGKLMPIIEFAALCGLFLFLSLRVVPDRVGIFLLFLLPIAFGLHVIEEFVYPGGFISWDNILRPKYTHTPGSFYVKINVFPSVASFALVLGAFDYAGKYSVPGIRGWFVFVIFVTWNAVFHVRGAIQTRTYSPGMVTGLLLCIPLTVVSCVHFKRSGVIGIPSLVLCATIALAIQPTLDLIKNRGLR